ncbi:hypothetical protein [Cupriavidus sp. CP313]
MDIERKNQCITTFIDSEALRTLSERDRHTARKVRAAQEILPQATQGIMSLWVEAAPSWRKNLDLDRLRLESD